MLSHLSNREFLVELKDRLEKEIKEQNINLLQLHIWRQKQINSSPGVYKVSRVDFVNQNKNSFGCSFNCVAQPVDEEKSVGIILVNESQIFINLQYAMTYQELCEEVV